VQSGAWEGSWTTTERGWEIPSFVNVRRAEILSWTWLRAARRHGGHQTGVAEAGQLVGQHRDLFLDGEDDLDARPFGYLQQLIEPGQGLPAEFGDTQ
jgi:hypothetical protein